MVYKLLRSISTIMVSGRAFDVLIYRGEPHNYMVNQLLTTETHLFGNKLIFGKSCFY